MCYGLSVTELVWIFGYGSLIWRPSFDFEHRVRGYVDGYARRFWQASTDHRGVPNHPGRVVTLHAEPGARCYGVAYALSAQMAERVLAALDERESGGYTRMHVSFHSKDREFNGTMNAITYTANAGNPNYVGEQPLETIAAVVRTASGPSGHNAEYVLKLAEALDALGVDDAHVFELANLISDPDQAQEDGA
jgi:cation transport regulator ChaC